MTEDQQAPAKVSILGLGVFREAINARKAFKFQAGVIAGAKTNRERARQNWVVARVRLAFAFVTFGAGIFLLIYDRGRSQLTTAGAAMVGAASGYMLK